MIELNGRSIAYLTDVEGNWDYFCRYVHLSKAVSFKEGHGAYSRNPELVLNDGWFFVFGGDVCDKGPGSIRVCTCLVNIKEEHPDRIILLIGNRDGNKMRLTSELQQSEMDAVQRLPAPYWLPEKKRVSPYRFLVQIASTVERTELSELSDELLTKYNTKANRLRWMLKETFGAPDDFEHRRQEMALIQGMEVAEVSDEMVVANYEDSVKSGGFMYKYLRLGQLAAVFGSADGPRTLFVHGGVIGHFNYHQQLESENCFGFVPNLHVGEYKYSPKDGTQAFAPAAAGGGGGDREMDVEKWVNKLNEWNEMQFEEWQQQAQWQTSLAEEELRWRGGLAFQDYVLVETAAVPSVVLGRHLEKSGMPKQMPADVSKMLNASGIRRLVVGHTPHGNCPTVIHNPCDGDSPSKSSEGGVSVEVIMADTSYSDMSASDNRGVAVSEVIIDGAGSQLSVHGCIHTGEEIEYCLCINGTGEHDSFIGKHVQFKEKEWFVKAKFKLEGELGPEYLLSRVWDGFKVGYERVSVSVLSAIIT